MLDTCETDDICIGLCLDCQIGSSDEADDGDDHERGGYHEAPVT